MSWIVAGTAIGSAVLGAAQGSAKRRAEQQQNQANANISAAQTAYSPWTHINPQGFQAQAPADSALGGAVQGGVGGALQGLQFKKAFAGGPQTPETPSDSGYSSPRRPYATGNY